MICASIASNSAVAADSEKIFGVFERLLNTALENDAKKKIETKLKEQQFERSLMSGAELKAFFKSSVIFGASLSGRSYWTLNYKNARAKFTYSSGRSESGPAGILGNRICFRFGTSRHRCRQVRVWQGSYTWVDAETKQETSRILFKRSITRRQQAGLKGLSCPAEFRRNCKKGVVIAQIN
jgi:hypothetical protein